MKFGFFFIFLKTLFFREEGNLGYSYNDFLEFIETRHQQKVAKENAALLANQNQAAQNVKTEPAAALNSINDLEESWKLDTFLVSKLGDSLFGFLTFLTKCSTFDTKFDYRGRI